MRLRIANWDENFESAASRKLKRLDWVAIPNKTDGEGYTALVDHPNAAAHLGAWYAIVEMASKQTPRSNRGNLPGGIPQDLGGICRSLGRSSRLPWKVFYEVIPRLLEIGWLEQVKENQQICAETVAESANVLAESANVVGDNGRMLAAHYRELQGTTGNYIHTEGNSRACVAADLNCQTSQRFEEFWNRWPRQVEKDSAARDWCSVVTIEVEPKVFACLDNYLASSEAVRGCVPYAGSNERKVGWIMKCHRDGWQCSWPPVAAAPHKESRAEMLHRQEQEAIEEAENR